MSISNWIQASRLPSQSYIFLPLLLGQALHLREGGTLSWQIFALVHLFGLFDQLYIVYANDVADRQSDALNTTGTIFSGGSRVLVDGQLTPKRLARAAALMALLCLGVSAALFGLYGRWLCLPLAVVALALLWLYSFGPVRLSYRGGGELLQMIGVGGVLPLYGYHAQSGAWASFPWPLLSVLLPTHLAAALATTLPDEPSDRRTSKRTFAVFFKPMVVKGAIVVLNLAALGALYAVWPHQPLVIGLPLAANLGQLALLRRARPGAPAMTALVGLALLVTLSLVAGMAVASWGAA